MSAHAKMWHGHARPCGGTASLHYAHFRVTLSAS